MMYGVCMVYTLTNLHEKISDIESGLCAGLHEDDVILLCILLGLLRLDLLSYIMEDSLIISMHTKHHTHTKSHHHTPYTIHLAYLSLGLHVCLVTSQGDDYVGVAPALQLLDPALGSVEAVLLIDSIIRGVRAG